MNLNKKLFGEYNKIESMIKDLTKEKKDLSLKILKEMGKNDLEKINADYGTFSIVKRRTYIFKDDVIDKIQKFKAKIKDAELNAIKNLEVEIETSESLRFQKTK